MPAHQPTRVTEAERSLLPVTQAMATRYALHAFAAWARGDRHTADHCARLSRIAAGIVREVGRFESAHD